ncbi:MAG: hypothetical protein KKC46_12135 [Proteobacteria bacterium]|nr:hypothetical protein [Pseudomonadota bacterium]
MNVKRKYIAGLILGIILIFTYSSLFAAGFTGKTYYTKVNIWYEKPNRILSTNYHRGNILPIGTKAKIHSIKDRKIQFTPEGSGQLFTIINQKNTSTISTDKLFNRYFSLKQINLSAGDYNKASVADIENIKKGIITMGMSKKAVIMAYGYPPTHKTPQLSSNAWRYWYARMHKVNVFFKNDKVFKIETIGPIPHPGFIKSDVKKTGGVREDELKAKKQKKNDKDADAEDYEDIDVE